MWLLVLALLVLGGVRDPHLGGWAAAVVALVTVIALPNLLARLNARLIISEETIGYRGILRKSRQCERSALDRVMRVRLEVLGPRFAFTRLLFLDRTGRALLSVQEEWWSRVDLDRLWALLALSVVDVEGTLEPRAANRRFPGAASFLLVHRVALSSVVFVIAAFIALAIIGAVAGSPPSR